MPNFKKIGFYKICLALSHITVFKSGHTVLYTSKVKQITTAGKGNRFEFREKCNWMCKIEIRYIKLEQN